MSKNPFNQNTNVDSIKRQFDLLKNTIIKDVNKADSDTYKGFQEIYGSLLSPQLTESELIFAITDVLIERGKEELATAFFSKMAERFEAKDSLIIKEFYINNIVQKDYKIIPIYLKNLFPNIYLMLKNSTEFISIQLNNTFKTALEKDLRGLLLNIDEYIIPEEYKKSIQYTLAKTIYKTIIALQNKRHPAIIFKKYSS